MTWFRREPDVNWLKGFGDDPEIQRKARALVQAQVSKEPGNVHP